MGSIEKPAMSGKVLTRVSVPTHSASVNNSPRRMISGSIFTKKGTRISKLLGLTVTVICAAILVTPLTAQAKRVESEKAQKVAQRFAESKRGSQAKTGVRLKYTGKRQRQGSGGGSGRPGTGPQGGQEDTLYYVFNINEDSSGGFIIVAGDDVAKPVLGYSDNGSYDENDLPPNFVYWMDFLQEQIAYAQEQNIPQSEDIQQEWDAFLSGNAQLRKTAAAVAPLIQTKWNQGDDTYPYNNMCPMDGKKQSVTGCVATAMAQIMKYHNHPARGIGQSKAYSTSSKKINVPSVNFEVNYDWDNMLNNYSRTCEWYQYLIFCSVKSNNWNTQQANAVATLMYHAGASVQMDYTSGGSGAYSSDASIALRDNFGYDMGIQMKYRGNNDATWEAMLKDQINAGMPIYYAGFGSSGGHAFICDGYDNNGKFHFNWGWGGHYDGYFVTTALNPSSGHAYNTMQEVIINIKPAPPTITAQLTARTVQVGQTAQFTVTAALNGASTLSYQWQVSTNGGSSFSNLSGAVSATYTTPAATVAMDGYRYRCVVKNNRGASVTSNPATLTVNPVAPTVIWPTAAAITYGNSLSTSTLTGGGATGVGGASVAGSFTWNNGSVIPTVANNGYGVTFTPYDNNYTVATKNNLAITVNKANPVYSVPTGLTAVYGDYLSNVTLPGSWSWDGAGSVGNAGTRIHKATFTPTDILNYKIANGIDVTVTVAKAAPVYTIPSGLTATYGDSLSSVVLPDGWSWNVMGMVGNAGTQIHKATFTPTDTGNYNVATDINLAVTVAKNALVYMVPVGVTAAYGDSLSSVILPENWSWDEIGTVGDVGTQIHKATFTPTDAVNYNIMTGVDVTVTVTKAVPVHTVPSGLTAVYGDVLSSVILPENWSWEGTGSVGDTGTRIHKATFTPTDTENYDIVAGIDVTITVVAKSVPLYTVPSGLTATYGDSLSHVALPEGWSWEETGTVGNAGTQTHKATFTPTDTKKYNVVTGINITIRVNTVNAATPIITAQPIGNTVALGRSYNLTVLANVNNGGTRFYQWYSNTSASNSGGTIISGATSSSYNVPTSTAGTYYYYVVVTNTIADNGDGGVKSASVTSSVAAVTVNSRVNAATPTITAQPAGDTVKVGESLTASVKATSSDGGTLSYAWYDGDGIVGTGSSYRVPTSTAGNYHYYVVVTNKITDNGDGGQKTASVTSEPITVTVKYPDAVQSSDRIIPTANHGDESAAVAPPAPLTAEFTAGPNPVGRSSGKVSFFRNGSRVAYATLSIYDAAGNVVKKIRVIDDAVGSQSRRKVSSWNLRDNNGRPVSEGTYLVKGVLKTSGGKRERVSVAVGVR